MDSFSSCLSDVVSHAGMEAETIDDEVIIVHPLHTLKECHICGGGELLHVSRRTGVIARNWLLLAPSQKTDRAWNGVGESGRHGGSEGRKTDETGRCRRVRCSIQWMSGGWTSVAERLMHSFCPFRVPVRSAMTSFFGQRCSWEVPKALIGKRHVGWRR